MRIQTWHDDGNGSALVSDNIDTLITADVRQGKYDEILSERENRLAVVSADMQEELDAFDVGAEPNQSKIQALKQARHDVRVKAKAVKVQVDARVNNTDIYGFDVKAAFDA